MFRGVNQLPGFGGYGSSISWTALTLTWSPTEHDAFSVASWAAFGLSESDYKEIDGIFTYTRTLGNLSLSAATPSMPCFPHRAAFTPTNLASRRPTI